jgi:hypothetical protein
MSCLIENGGSGVIERAIESWLTKTNERNYQLPFCQVLLKNGHRVVYVSRHRPLEQGKDIVAIDTSGRALAYQLKTGNIDIGTWRNINGEIVDLISLPIDHPSVEKPNDPSNPSRWGTLMHSFARAFRLVSVKHRTTKIHRAYLVTNGELTDEVRTIIGDMNEDNKRRNRGWAYLDVIEKNELLKMFIEAQGSFLPTELANFARFLEFFTADGREFLDKEKLSAFLDEAVFQNEKSKANQRNAIIGSAILLAEMLRSYQAVNNHYAQFEAWMLLCAHMIHFADTQGMNRKDWEDSLKLAADEAKWRLRELRDEALGRDDFFEGNAMGDGGALYRARLSLVIGALAAITCDDRDNHDGQELEKLLTRFDAMIRENSARLLYWGESAFPFFYWIIRYCECRESGNRALLAILLEAIVDKSSDENAGVPDPYYSVRQVIENMLGVEQHFQTTQFVGRSWSLRPLVEMAARRGMREDVAAFWNPISKLACREFVLAEEVDFFRWLSPKGSNHSMQMAGTQSWKALVDEASNRTFPDIWSEHRGLMGLLFLVYPHRLSPQFVHFLDNLTVTLPQIGGS